MHKNKQPLELLLKSVTFLILDKIIEAVKASQCHSFTSASAIPKAY